MSLKPYHPAITQTPAELRAKARDYDQRGLTALAETCRKQAAYVERRNKR
jgi:hypothetical protein